MRKNLVKLASFLLVFVMVLTSAVAAVSAQTDFSLYTLELEDIVNPLSGEEKPNTKAESFSLSVTPEKYFADPFNVELCVSDNKSIANRIRSVMVDRNEKLDVYYKCDFQHNSETLSQLLNEWLKLVFAETDKSNEGDYLHWHYERISAGNVTILKYKTSDTYYYHIPLEFDYYTTQWQEVELDVAISGVIYNFGFDEFTTPRQKCDAIYEYITDNVTYDYDNLYDDSYKLKFTAYAALKNGTAVCQGYATLFYRMARECGLETRVITGVSFGQNHAWNIVKIGSEYYYLDATWDAGNTEYDYYLKGSTTFVAKHTPSDEFLTSEFKSKYPISETDMNLSDDGLSDDFEYYTYMGKAYISGYIGDETNVIVPGEIGGYPVYRVDSGVFADNNVVETLTFSEGIERLGEGAVEGCSKLTRVNLPSTMQIVYEKNTSETKSGYTEAPIGCENLKVITVPYNNPYHSAFDGILYSKEYEAVILCPADISKSGVTIQDGVEDIAPFAFYDCDELKKITMPDTVKMIGYWAFCNARALEEINISEACEFIGQFAFANTKLEEITIPEEVKTIMGGAFGMDTDLKTITVDPDNENFYNQNGALIYHNTEFDTYSILDYETANTNKLYIVPSEVWEIDQYAFANAQYLEDVIIHDGVEYIRSYSFENCDALTFFIFPEGIKDIESAVLLNCDNIMSVVVPSSVTAIGEMLVHDNDGYTIYGQKGSVTEQYATNNSLKFKELDDFVCAEGHTITKQYIDDYTRHNVCTVCGDCAKTEYLYDIDSLAQFAKVEYEYYLYTGKEIKPRIAVFKDGEGKKLVEGVDYKITDYRDNINVGTGYIEVQGIGKFGGKGYIDFEIHPIDISQAEIGIEYLTTEYDGQEKRPVVQIAGMNEYDDFTVEYYDNVNPGKASAVIIAWGNYEGNITVNFEITLAAPKKVTASLYGNNDVKLSWNKVMGADGYHIYYKKSNSSSYSLKADTESLSYSFANLSYNTKYDFKVVAYYLAGHVKKLSASYNTATATTIKNLSAPSKVSVSLYDYNDAKVSWSKVSGAKGYYVYYKTASSKKYTYAGKTTATSFKKANLSGGVKYTFKVVPYSVSGGKIVLDDSYKLDSVYTLKKLSAPKITKSSNKVKVSWSNINGESGYQISQSTSKGKTKVVSTYYTTGGKSKTLKATKKKTYYYKVRAFVKVGKTVIYGPWSTVKAYKLK